MQNSYLLETLQAAADLSLSVIAINSELVADDIGTGWLTVGWDVLGGWTEHVKSQHPLYTNN